MKAPTRRGFGSELIEGSLKAHGGEVIVDFAVDGMTCEIMLPLSDVTNSPMGAYGALLTESVSTSGSPSTYGPSVRNKRILVVDDEALVAMDVSEILSQQGAVVVGPAATFDSAKSLIEAGNIDAALLDANLAGHPVDELAAALTRLDIPFAFLTGYGRESLPEAFRQSPLLTKPYSHMQLIAAVTQFFEPE